MDSDPAPRPLSPADHALLLAARVWGDGSAAFSGHFRSDYRSSLLRAWRSAPAASSKDSLGRLRDEHAAQARPDLSRVHASWWVRSLANEPESVRRAVASHLPNEIAGAVRDGLKLSTSDLANDHEPEPVALRTVLSLWTVRLVGDLPERDDDPPVIVAMTRFDSSELALLIRTTGLAKWAMTFKVPGVLGELDQDRLTWLRGRVGEVDPRFSLVIGRDTDALDPNSPLAVARAGMTTFARLLGEADPYRARWALQHLPYSTASSFRTLMGPGGRRTPMLARWEVRLLGAAWERLRNEGRLHVVSGGLSS